MQTLLPSCSEVVGFHSCKKTHTFGFRNTVSNMKPVSQPNLPTLQDEVTPVQVTHQTSSNVPEQLLYQTCTLLFRATYLSFACYSLDSFYKLRHPKHNYQSQCLYTARLQGIAFKASLFWQSAPVSSSFERLQNPTLSKFTFHLPKNSMFDV